jgi:L-threonylcarbamoyladenylate synthase
MAELGQNLDTAARFLADDDVVAIPTETVYGLAGRIDSEKAIRKIFEVKNRPFTDPLIVHVADVPSIETLVLFFPTLARRLLEAFSPGPLTKSKLVSDLVTNGSPLVAIRIPDHPLTLSLLKLIDKPLAAPSANPFGGISPTTAQHVQDGLGSKIPYILDGGACEVGVESTIIQITGDDQIKVLRQGGIPEEELALFAELVREENPEKPVVPGSMLSHYAPVKPLFLATVSGTEPHSPETTGVLAFDSYLNGIPQSNQILLSPSGNLKEAAQNLFQALHRLDSMSVESIVAVPLPDKGLGRAVNDRVFRASQKRPV